MIDPVVLVPLRRRWEVSQARADELKADYDTAKAAAAKKSFAELRRDRSLDRTRTALQSHLAAFQRDSEPCCR